ncbi:MAG: ribonuclease P protein component [Terriglobales bacterium]
MTLAHGPRNAVRFPRSARLLHRSDFERVYRGGKKHFTGSMTVFFLRRDPAQGGPRIGLTVGRALGGAVVRNRIRRRMREAVRLSLGSLRESVDLVLHPRKSVLEADFAALCGEVSGAFAAVATKLAGQARPGGN